MNASIVLMYMAIYGICICCIQSNTRIVYIDKYLLPLANCINSLNSHIFRFIFPTFQYDLNTVECYEFIFVLVFIAYSRCKDSYSNYCMNAFPKNDHYFYPVNFPVW